MSYFQLLSSPTVYTCAPPSLIVSASHVPSSSAILIVDIPHIIDPPHLALQKHVLGHLHMTVARFKL